MANGVEIEPGRGKNRRAVVNQRSPSRRESIGWKPGKWGGEAGVAGHQETTVIPGTRTTRG